MLSSVVYENGVWIVEDIESGLEITAEQVIADFEFVREGYGRGIVRVVHGVPLEQVDRIPPSIHRDMGITAPATRLGAPPKGVRRYRCLPGGQIEPFTLNR